MLEDVRKFGNLNTISTYPFENCLQTMKRKLRSVNSPLEQIGRRFSEIECELNSKPFDLSLQKKCQELIAGELKYPFENDIKKV